MWSRPALPNICGAGGDASGSRDLEHPHRVAVERVGAVGVLDPEAARLHLLEADRHRAVGEAALDRLAGQEQRRGAGRAVVVDVDDRDPGQAQLVERPLAVGRVAVAVAGVGLLDVARRGCRRRPAPSPPPPWPSRGSRPPWSRASRTWSSRPRSRTSGRSKSAPLVAAALPRRQFGWSAKRYRAAALGGPGTGSWAAATDPPSPPPGSARSRRRGRRSAMPERGAERALAGGVQGALAEGVGEQHDVGGDRRGEQRVLDGQQAEGERRGDGEDRATTTGRRRRRPRPARWRGSARAAVPTARRIRRWSVSSRSGRITKRIVSGIQKPCSRRSKIR